MADLLLPDIPPKYDPAVERDRSDAMERADSHNIKLWQHLVLQSPDGSRWIIVVDNAGALSTSPA